MSTPSNIDFTLNFQPVRLKTRSDRKLLWVLRTDLGLTGTKYGCGAGYCGACTVIVAGKALRSCQTPLSAVAGQDVVTIEGLAHGSDLHALQRAFIDHGGFQCGFCTAGMLLTAAVLLRDTPNPSREAVVRAMDDNLCRCGAHTRIITAILSASRAN